MHVPHLERLSEDCFAVAGLCFAGGLTGHGRQNSVPHLSGAPATDGQMVPVQRRIHPCAQPRIPWRERMNMSVRLGCLQPNEGCTNARLSDSYSQSLFIAYSMAYKHSVFTNQGPAMLEGCLVWLYPRNKRLLGLVPPKEDELRAKRSQE